MMIKRIMKRRLLKWSANSFQNTTLMFLGLAKIFEVDFFQGRVFGAQLEQLQPLARHRIDDLPAHILGAAQKPAAGSLFDLIDAVNTLKITLQAVGIAADFEQKIPLAPFQNRLSQLVHLALNDQLASNDDADPVADILNLLQLMGRKHDRESVLAVQIFDQFENTNGAVGIDAQGRLI